jgi:hypothetical protein
MKKMKEGKLNKEEQVEYDSILPNIVHLNQSNFDKGK